MLKSNYIVPLKDTSVDRCQRLPQLILQIDMLVKTTLSRSSDCLPREVMPGDASLYDDDMPLILRDRSLSELITVWYKEVWCRKAYSSVDAFIPFIIYFYLVDQKL